VSLPGSPDLAVQIGALRLANPILAASGTFGYGAEFAHLTDLNQLGGFVVKGLSAQPMAGADLPRLYPTAGGMINAVGLQNLGVRAFVAEKLPALRSYRTAVIANVFGQTSEEYAEVIRVLEDAEGLAAYELNISCPNVKKGGMQYGNDPALTEEVVGTARAAARRRPLWVKLSPLVSDIKAIARAAAAAGANALSVANTYPAMALDPVSRRSRLGNPTGGLSGPAIKPITLRLVHEVAQAVSIPIIGLGGIETPQDAAEYLLAGATAVQVGTASFVHPGACQRLVEDLSTWCSANNINNINELRGALV
jgi:dihydroorotate dehydrogenase (NAD+) catalytic subunit